MSTETNPTPEGKEKKRSVVDAIVADLVSTAIWLKIEKDVEKAMK